MRRWEKVFWALVAGAALGSAGCSTSEPLYGAPVDTTTDEESDPAAEAADDPVEDALEDVIEDVNDDEMPATEYGPPPDM